MAAENMLHRENMLHKVAVAQPTTTKVEQSCLGGLQQVVEARVAGVTELTTTQRHRVKDFKERMPTDWPHCSPADPSLALQSWLLPCPSCSVATRLATAASSRPACRGGAAAVVPTEEECKEAGWRLGHTKRPPAPQCALLKG